MKKTVSRMPAPMVAPAMMPTGNTSSDEEGKEGVRMEPLQRSELSAGSRPGWL